MVDFGHYQAAGREYVGHRTALHSSIHLFLDWGCSCVGNSDIIMYISKYFREM